MLNKFPHLYLFGMNIPDFVLNWNFNWIIVWPNSLQKWFSKTYRTWLLPDQVFQTISKGLISTSQMVNAFVFITSSEVMSSCNNAKTSHAGCTQACNIEQNLSFKYCVSFLFKFWTKPPVFPSWKLVPQGNLKVEQRETSKSQQINPW